MRKLFLTLIFLINITTAFAQVSVNADVDKTILDLQDNIRLSINVSADTTGISVTEMPSLPNFNIYSSGQSTSYSMINGKVRASVVFNYILSPRFVGKTEIGPFKVKVGKQFYNTEPIPVEITRDPSQIANQNQGNTNQANQKMQVPTSKQISANSATPTGKTPPIFMTATTNVKEAYVNEQINLKVRFYQNNRNRFLGNSYYERPIVKGLVLEELSQKDGYENIGNENYAYTEFDIALFGLASGKAEVGPASVTYTIQENVFDMFDQFFGGGININMGGTAKKVETKPIQLNILPLPLQNKPKTFYGAVGDNFTITTSLDNKEVQAGEPINFTITIKGTGNMRAINDIPLPDLGANFRVYETSSSIKNDKNRGLLGGTKTYKTVIVPRVSGNYEIGGIEFSYFNPKTKKYNTITSQPISLKVLPSSAQTSQTLNFGEQVSASNGQVEKLNNDISYIKQGKASIFSVILTKFANFGLYNLFSLVLLLLAFFIRLMQKGEISLFDSKYIYFTSKRNINKAKTLDEIANSLQNYLEGKLGSPIGIRSIEDISKQLKLSDHTTQDLIELWQHFDMLKYAPSSLIKDTNAVEQDKNKTLLLLATLEKEIK